MSPFVNIFVSKEDVIVKTLVYQNKINKIQLNSATIYLHNINVTRDRTIKSNSSL